MSVPVGSIWLENSSGRLIKILEERVHGTGPAWTYCDKDGNPEPDGPNHPDWFWHYCDIADFVLWERFKQIS